MKYSYVNLFAIVFISPSPIKLFLELEHQIKLLLHLLNQNQGPTIYQKMPLLKESK